MTKVRCNLSHHFFTNDPILESGSWRWRLCWPPFMATKHGKLWEASEHLTVLQLNHYFRKIEIIDPYMKNSYSPLLWCKFQEILSNVTQQKFAWGRSSCPNEGPVQHSTMDHWSFGTSWHWETTKAGEKQLHWFSCNFGLKIAFPRNRLHRYCTM